MWVERNALGQQQCNTTGVWKTGRWYKNSGNGWLLVSTMDELEKENKRLKGINHQLKWKCESQRVSLATDKETFTSCIHRAVKTRQLQAQGFNYVMTISWWLLSFSCQRWAGRRVTIQAPATDPVYQEELRLLLYHVGRKDCLWQLGHLLGHLWQSFPCSLLFINGNVL